MNILKARNELHQIVQNNPEIEHSSFFQFDLSNDDAHMTTKWTSQRPYKFIHSHHQQVIKDESVKIMAQKGNSQQKVEVKTPIFKNKKGEDFSTSQKQRFQKLGLESFLKQSKLDKKSVQKCQQPEEQKIIKNLNNTYFRTTEHIHANRKSMVNSLGIKKSSMSYYKVQWDEKNLDQLEIQWKEIGYIPNKVFPCRKNSSIKNKIYTPKKHQSTQKYSMEINDLSKLKDQSKIEKTYSIGFLQSKDLGTKNSLLSLNQKPNWPRNMNRGRKTFLNTSKSLNKSQQLLNKKDISKVLSTVQNLRSHSENRKRPWTSKQAVMRNQKVSEQLSQQLLGKRYSQNANNSFQNFRQSWIRQRIDSRTCVKKYSEQSTDYIKGKKMSIHQITENKSVLIA